MHGRQANDWAGCGTRARDEQDAGGKAGEEDGKHGGRVASWEMQRDVRVMVANGVGG